MDFTREPIIESIITPKEGCKLVIRSSKGVGQEEFFVDAVEVVSFGNTFFLRSLERPKSFLVPVNDYEILEVRETRMVLKNVGIDRAIKIGKGREGGKRTPKETPAESMSEETSAATEEVEEVKEGKADVRAGGDKRRERRRQQRRKRGRDDTSEKEQTEDTLSAAKIDLEPPQPTEISEETIKANAAILSSLLAPPTTLISETIERYRDNEMFKNVFFPKGVGAADDEEAQEAERAESFETPPLEDMEEGSSMQQYFKQPESFEDDQELQSRFAYSQEEASEQSEDKKSDTSKFFENEQEGPPVIADIEDEQSSSRENSTPF